MKTLTSLAFLALVSASLAFGQAQPRHIDFTQTLNGLGGKPLMDPTVKPPIPMTLGDVAVIALEAQTADDQRTPGAEKFKLDRLAQRIYENKDVVLSVEEMATIKDRIGKTYGPLVVGAAWRILDPAQK